MKPTRRSLFVPSLALALAGCLGGGGGPPPDPAAESTAARTLDGLKVVPPVERATPDGQILLTVGKLEVPAPAGWHMQRLGGQVQYMGPGMQEQMLVTGYVSDAPMSEERQKAVLAALNIVGGQVERTMGRFAKVTVSQPVAGKTAWGHDTRFSALGPINRTAFHYATASANEVMMVQFEGNNMANTPVHAVEMIRSFRYRDGAAAPAAAPTPAPAPSVKPIK